MRRCIIAWIIQPVCAAARMTSSTHSMRVKIGGPTCGSQLVKFNWRRPRTNKLFVCEERTVRFPTDSQTTPFFAALEIMNGHRFWRGLKLRLSLRNLDTTWPSGAGNWNCKRARRKSTAFCRCSRSSRCRRETCQNEHSQFTQTASGRNGRHCHAGAAVHHAPLYHRQHPLVVQPGAGVETSGTTPDQAAGRPECNQPPCHHQHPDGCSAGAIANRSRMISSSDRIILIRKSLNIFVCGLIGLVPVIGFIPALFAIVGAVRVSARFRREWNPASAYLSAGVTMALLGTGITALAGLIAVLNLVPPFASD